MSEIRMLGSKTITEYHESLGIDDSRNEMQMCFLDDCIPDYCGACLKPIDKEFKTKNPVRAIYSYCSRKTSKSWVSVTCTNCYDRIKRKCAEILSKKQ